MDNQQWIDLGSDEKRWAWILANKESVFFMLDNDSTYVLIRDTDYAFKLKNYIGNSQGIVELLNVLGIESDSV